MLSPKSLDLLFSRKNVGAFHLLIMLIACSLSGCNKLSPKLENYYRVAGQANKAITKELPLESNGIGGIMPIKIEAYVGVFDSKYPLNTDQARWIIVHAAELSLKLFNHDPGIQEFLIQRPFNAENLLLSVYYLNSETLTQDAIIIARGSLRFRRKSTSGGPYPLLFEEAYEEALQKVEGQPYPQ